MRHASSPWVPTARVATAAAHISTASSSAPGRRSSRVSSSWTRERGALPTAACSLMRATRPRISSPSRARNTCSRTTCATSPRSPWTTRRFDHVVLTQVLEHVPEPARVLAELHRVLKPGGTLWLTAPFFYAEHERPYDFFRYTQFGLRRLLESAGFEVLEVEWMEGYLGTLSYQARLMSRALPSSRADYGGGLSGVALAAAAKVSKRIGRRAADALATLDLKHKFVGKGLPKNYQVVAKK